jgi:hypothetical protein
MGISSKFREVSINQFTRALNLLPEFNGIGLVDIGAAGDLLKKISTMLVLNQMKNQGMRY